MSIVEHNPAHVNRLYQRGTHFAIDAGFSTDDGVNWKSARVTDLSSGGLMLETDNFLGKGEEIWLDLNIRGFFNEFDFKVKAAVIRMTGGDPRYFYGVTFKNLPPDIAVRIDENVKNDRPVEGTPYLGE